MPLEIALVDQSAQNGEQAGRGCAQPWLGRASTNPRDAGRLRASRTDKSFQIGAALCGTREDVVPPTSDTFNRTTQNIAGRGRAWPLTLQI